MCHASRRRCSVGPEVYLRGASSSSRCAGAQAQRPIAPSVALSLSLHLPNYNLPPHPPSTVHRPPSTAHRPPPTAHRPPPAARLEVRKHGQPDEAGPRPVRAAGRFRQVAARASRALGTDAGQRQRTQPDAHTARWLASRPRPPPGIAWPAGGGWRTRLDRMRGGVKGEQRGTS